ncbi:hypothetical protein AC578_8462 [Pseudocercospora eumusae]|uniref:Uncharacterized protein n=1 Tax=Pseudocercospora eumusae TaxID=321146 RepID=A0A139GXC5_9PEZI|nr:hypothetical protein AC578_8462 [Pseudocercospora eumusae]
MHVRQFRGSMHSEPHFTGKVSMAVTRLYHFSHSSELGFSNNIALCCPRFLDSAQLSRCISMGLCEDLHPNWDIDERYIKLIWGFKHPELADDLNGIFREATKELSLLLIFVAILLGSVMAWYFVFLKPKLAKALRRCLGRLSAFRLTMPGSFCNRSQRVLGLALAFAFEHYIFAHLLSTAVGEAFAYTFAGRVLLLEMEAGWVIRWMASTSEAQRRRGDVVKVEDAR